MKCGMVVIFTLAVEFKSLTTINIKAQLRYLNTIYFSTADRFISSGLAPDYHILCKFVHLARLIVLLV